VPQVKGSDGPGDGLRVLPCRTVQERLEQIVQRFGADTGTLHLVEDGVLVLKGQVGLPPRVAEIVKRVPMGKGMAGLAAERNAPVSACNIQTDTSGDVRPGAKQTGVNGAIVVPIRDGAGAVRGTLGIGVHRVYDYTDEETERLMAEASNLMRTD
jgi:putative methionine-R-sulfoxide reductase with GAF domain